MRDVPRRESRLGLGLLLACIVQNSPSTADRAAAWREEKLERQVSALATACDLEPALPLARPFDPRKLHVETAVSASEELEQLAGILREAESLVSRDPKATYPISRGRVAERLALFPWRFGVSPHDVAGWDAVAAGAGRVLSYMAAQGQPGERDDWGRLLQAQLLDVCGRRDESEALLDSFVTHGTGCGNCTAGRNDGLALARSVLAERRGQLDQAVLLLGDALCDDYGFGLRLDDAHVTRFGLLLLATGNAELGSCLLQRVVDLCPRTPGAEVARAALDQVGALRPPTFERLRALYVDVPEAEARFKSQAVRALGEHGFPESYAFLLQARLDGDDTALAALARLGDERCRELFEYTLRVKDVSEVLTALDGLELLDGGARPYVREALLSVRLFHGDDRFIGDAWLDKPLRRICGGGPDPEAALGGKPAEFFDSWLAWLEVNGL